MCMAVWFAVTVGSAFPKTKVCNCCFRLTLLCFLLILAHLGLHLVSKYYVYLVHMLYPFQGVQTLEIYMSVLAC